MAETSTQEERQTRMSIQRLHDIHHTVAGMGTGPFAWIIVANPVWGRCEDRNLIAIFDTWEQAEAYEAASRLPEPTKTDDGIRRTYRPDSLLYDYNPPYSWGGMFQAVENPMFHWECPENPLRPSGDVPPMRLLNHPRTVRRPR